MLFLAIRQVLHTTTHSGNTKQYHATQHLSFLPLSYLLRQLLSTFFLPFSVSHVRFPLILLTPLPLFTSYSPHHPFTFSPLLPLPVTSPCYSLFHHPSLSLTLPFALPLSYFPLLSDTYVLSSPLFTTTFSLHLPQGDWGHLITRN